jgi:hypothetical protein
VDRLLRPLEAEAQVRPGDAGAGGEVVVVQPQPGVPPHPFAAFGDEPHLVEAGHEPGQRLEGPRHGRCGQHPGHVPAEELGVGAAGAGAADDHTADVNAEPVVLSSHELSLGARELQQN